MRYSPRFSRPAVAVALLALSLPATGTVAQGKPATKPLAPKPPALSPAMAPITRAVSRAISGNRAYRTVDYVQRYFRLPGNRGFDLAIDTVASLLRVAGYVEETTAPPSARLVYRIESRPMRDLAWTPEGASITIVGQSAPLQTWPKNLNMIAINSVSTAPEGVTAPVIDVGAGAEADFAAVDVKGKIVLAEFGFGGKLLPSFPQWVINGQKPSRLAWILKEKILPPVYWKAMLRGREWMVDPEQTKSRTPDT